MDYQLCCSWHVPFSRRFLTESLSLSLSLFSRSAMEGKFYRFKTANHPHTNMAKAALNMMTRTSADALKDEGIYMNSVDTGWINDENPLEKAAVSLHQRNTHARKRNQTCPPACRLIRSVYVPDTDSDRSITSQLCRCQCSCSLVCAGG